MKKLLLFTLFALVACLLCSMSAAASEAYACYTSSNTTLTFYYDNQRSSRSGTTYDLNEGSNMPGWRTDGTNASVTQVVFDPSFVVYLPQTTYFWFFGMNKLTTITGMKQYLMTSAVKNMSNMFYGCSSLTSLDVSGFNTIQVTDMERMFFGCNKLTSLDLSSFNTAQVTNMTHMFRSCHSLTSLDLSGFNTARVTGMQNMFHGCNGLTSLDLRGFNTAQVTNMEHMFYDCSNLTTIIAGSRWTTDAVTNSSLMFYNCTSLVGGQGTAYDIYYLDATYAHCDGGPSNPGYFTALTEAYACYTPSNTTLTFYYDNLRYTRTGTTYNLNRGYLMPDWNTDNIFAFVTQVVFDPSFAGARPTSTDSWFNGMCNLTSITGMKQYLNTSSVTNMSLMFWNCNLLTSLDLSGFNTIQVTDMKRMFERCSGLTRIYVGSGWTTDAVTTSKDMFLNCTSLVGGEGTAYDANHTDATYARIDGGPSNPGYFTEQTVEAYACYSPLNTTLTFYYDDMRNSRSGRTYDLNREYDNPAWITDNTADSVARVVFDPSFASARPTSTYRWFYFMEFIQTIEGINYLNTSEVTNMASMFSHCKGLTSIDLSGFNTAQVTSMSNMFDECSSLTSLDLSSFNTAKVKDVYRMFYVCTNLTTIYAGSGWTTDAVTFSINMFQACTSLVGGQGTAYDANHTDATYARIDGGPSNPGYFTEKPAEAYACYTSSNRTLTFYYDNQRSSREGTTYDLNVGSNQPGWVVDKTYHHVNQVVIDPSFVEARPTSTCAWFYCMENVKSITGLDYLNTEHVTNMAAMFIDCKGLTSLDLSHFNTAMVTDIFNMFCQCSNLASLDVSSFNTAGVHDMRGMFKECGKLTSLDLSSFNTAIVTNMNEMFSGDTQLVTIYAGDGWSLAGIDYYYNMFENCTSLVGGQGTTYDANHVNGEYAHIDGGPSNPGYFTAPPEAYACYTSSNTTLTFYCDNQRSSREGTTYDLNDGTNYPGWRSDGTNANVTKVVFNPSFANARPTSTYYWFTAMRNLTSITGLSYLNTKNVTTMMSMFFGCSGLTSLDVSHFNTAQVTNMGLMFYQCSGLTSLDLSDFNTAKVTNMIYMFNGCSNLTTIYAGSGWTTASSSGNMFYNCTSLVGGMGTTYDANHVDGEYAHIDGGPSNPGYFTEGGAHGDVNGDSAVNITDVTALIDLLLSGAVPPAAADCNRDGNVNITDVTALIDYLLSGSW